mgnify:CR=1 FL=1
MAIEQFMPTADAKHTTEKEVRQKPSVAELTKVESPGKPVPATSLEDNNAPKKRRRRKKKATSEKVSIRAPKKDSILIITEKPQAAQKIASALGNERKYTENGVSYYELQRDGENILVASAVGHLYNLTYSKGQRGWPIFKIEWIPTHENKKTSYTKKYYSLLKKLTRRAKDFIIATDFDVEGEVIGWNVLRFICKKKNAKRMKYSTLTKVELEKSYSNLLKELNWGNAYAGETRHILDWLYGINLSRALMSAIKKTSSFRILSIGRVQGPALKIIVEREREIEKFKPEPYWQVFAYVGKQEFKHPKDIFDKKKLEKFKKVKQAHAETKKKEESITPPVPFDLTTLQREAYRHHRMSPSETLQIAQKLYLDGMISYPRTSSQKIPKEINPKQILLKLSKHYSDEVSIAKRSKPMEGKKSDPAHPSIYPTGDHKKLSDREEKLYDLIVRRFISAFCPDAKTANKRVTLKAINDKKLNFTASGMKVLEKGWTNVYPAKMEESDIDDYEGIIDIDKIDFTEKETKPPKRYSPTSLVTILEKKNLGTKATRSIIVDTLFQRGYLDGKSIKATPLGLKLIEALEKYSPIIIDEELTRQIEKEMEKIESENDPKKLEDEEKKFVTHAEKIITDISKDFKQHEEKIGKMLQKGLINFREEQAESNKLRECPTCKKGHLRILYARAYKRYFVGCTNYPKCKQTYTLPPNSLIKKSDKECEYCGWGKLLAIRKGKRPWEFCFNPDCEEVKRQREKWEKRKAAMEAKKKKS